MNNIVKIFMIKNNSNVKLKDQIKSQVEVKCSTILKQIG